MKIISYINSKKSKGFTIVELVVVDIFDFKNK